MDTPIDQNLPPLSMDALARDAQAAGAEPKAPPLDETETSSGDASAEEGSPDVAIETAPGELPPG